jgi:hypothetical protein
VLLGCSGIVPTGKIENLSLHLSFTARHLGRHFIHPAFFLRFACRFLLLFLPCGRRHLKIYFRGGSDFPETRRFTSSAHSPLFGRSARFSSHVPASFFSPAICFFCATLKAFVSLAALSLATYDHIACFTWVWPVKVQQQPNR